MLISLRKLWMEIIYVQTLNIFLMYQRTLTQKNDCDKGWFGSNCQFKCRCERDLCDTDGSCQSGIRCNSGWFGFKCQYRDIKFYATVNPIPPGNYLGLWADRGANETCIYHKDLQSVEFILEQPYAFTWLRIVDKVKTSTTKIILSFKLGKQLIECQNQTLTLLDVETIELKCENYVIVDSIVLQGDIIKSMCTIYINGGRNVALRGTTNSSSSFGDFDNHKLAVDGNYSPKFRDGSCTHSGYTDMMPSWTLAFSKPFSISRFVLYNRGDCCSERLAEFSLETQDRTGSTNFNYIGPRDVKIVYTVLPSKPLEISHLNIQLTKSVKAERLLVLCEVEVFGDCPPTKWGLECDKECDSNCPTTCRKDDGICVTNCIGYDNPPYCTNKCAQGRCGINCKDRCPSDGNLSQCNTSTGNCEGCADNLTRPNSTHAPERIEPSIDDTSFGAGFGVGVAAMILIFSLVMIIIQVCVRHRKRTVQLQSTYDHPIIMEVDAHGYEQVKAGKRSSDKGTNHEILQSQYVNNVNPMSDTKQSEYESIDSV